MLLFSWSTNKFHLANQINLADNNLYIIRTDSHEIRLNPAWDEHARNYIPCQLGFYLGYLRGKSPPPQKNLVIITVYEQLCRKNHPDVTRLVNTLQHFSKLCLEMHQIASQRIFISKNFRWGGEPPDPLRMLVAFGHSGLLPYLINPR